MTTPSPLRYPGGKSKAVEQIAARLPAEGFADFREPFVGGGSVFLHVRRQFPEASVWINDLNHDLYCFWKHAQADSERLADEVRRIKRETTDGRALFRELTTEKASGLSEFDNAARFFVLNRITFSGTVDSGGYSQKAYETRFTDTAIERLRRLSPALRGVRVTNLDYREVLREPGSDVFVFLDPPYFSATKSRLYGRRGALHTGFDHEEFAATLRACPHRWLVTYDDSPEIRRNFDFANLREWELQYGMNNFRRDHAPKGKELFITNYPAESHGARREAEYAA